MRRLFAYIVLILSMLGIVVFNVQSSTDALNWTQEFDKGTEVVYRVESTNEESIDKEELIEIMGNRLEAAGATNYSLEAAEGYAEGADDEKCYEVRIILGSRHKSNVDNILRSTMAAGIFQFGSTDGTYLTDEEAIVRGTAEIYDYDEEYMPYVRVEVTEEVVNVVEHCEEDDKLLVLWQNKGEVDFSDLASDDGDSVIEEVEGQTISQLKERVVSVIDLNLPTQAEGETEAPIDTTRFEEGTDDENGKYFVYFNAYGYAGDDAASTNQMTSNAAKSFVNLLNSELLNLRINEVYRRAYDASYGDDAMTRLIITAAVAYVVVSICLLIANGLSAVTGCVGMGLTLVSVLGLLYFFNIQINPSMILALVISLALSVNMLSVYYNRTKEDALHGRQLGKASNEGFRKAVSTSVDSTVLLVSLSIILALIARENVKSFCLFILISSLFTIIFVFLVSKLINNFIHNSKAADNLKLFSINPDNVEDLNGNVKTPIKESKLEKIDLKKNKKLPGLLLLGGLVLGVAGCLISGLANNGDVFNYTNEASYGRIEVRSGYEELFSEMPDDYVMTDEQRRDNLSDDNFKLFLENLSTEENPIEVNKVWVITDQINPYETDDKCYVYFYADLAQPLDEGTAEIVTTALNDFVTTYDDEYAFVASYTVTPGVVTSDFNNSLILISVTVGVTLLYFIIRYRYSLALSSVITSIVGSGATIGLISAVRLAVSAHVGIGILAGGLIVSLALIPLFNRIGQLKNESKVKVTTYEQREEISLKAYKLQIKSLVSTLVMVLAIFVVAMIISPVDMLPIYIATEISLVFNGLLALFALIPLHLWFERHLKFTALKNRRAKSLKNKREKRLKENRNKGAEPEEIIIPGIND